MTNDEKKVCQLMWVLFGVDPFEHVTIADITEEYLEMIEREARGIAPSPEFQARFMERLRQEGLIQ